MSIDTDNFQTPQIRRLTIHEGEIIFLSKVNKSKQKDAEAELDYKQILQDLVFEMSQQQQSPKSQISKMNQRVIKPGSIGLNAKNPAQEFLVESIFLRPSGLAYKGKFKLSINASDEMSWSKTVIVEIDDILALDGETITGIYNYNTGNVE